ncbi:MAG TPA: thiamine pyrophosphate-binding protein [Acidobacteriaceae bacterium]
MKYSDQLADWLRELGYTHCFFVAGGNIMHLLESCSHRFTCIPVVHEVAAGIASEYFNEVSSEGRAFALVTAGPGLTNIVTAMAGAYLESRELLVVGGQVKVSDLARGQVRQRGIQEIDGVSIARPVTVTSALMDTPIDRAAFVRLAESGSHARKGPVFLEVPLDIQGAKVDEASFHTSVPAEECTAFAPVKDDVLPEIASLLRRAQRPALLIGGGVSHDTSQRLLDRLATLGVPLFATWNGIDRIPEDHPLFFGRPNTWGQRGANILMQQADLLIALGTRLGLQQTGFNWQQFVPLGKVVQVECDRAELEKGHPRVDLPVCGDANDVLDFIARQSDLPAYHAWVAFCRKVRSLIPLNDPANHTGEGFVSPYDFCMKLSNLCTAEDVVIPCSSGSANTVMMQAFRVKRGQRVFNDKGLASMGYGLSGAIGAALAAKGRRTFLIEGDGGFIQNLQELGTVSVNKLNLKIFIFDDNGYASIRMTQKNYFGGSYIGCDTATGLGIPRWESLFAAYDIPLQTLGPGFESDPAFLAAVDSRGPSAFLVRIDPQQTYFPKISSRVTASGSMESNPLHFMSPELDEKLAAEVLPYIRAAS